MTQKRRRSMLQMKSGRQQFSYGKLLDALTALEVEKIEALGYDLHALSQDLAHLMSTKEFLKTGHAYLVIRRQSLDKFGPTPAEVSLCSNLLPIARRYLGLQI
eukprot:GFKZ01005472.1.p2 GENE.GFKZ01005472.1~~GFKZ01005472.1.p2  ORF type:complete len:103 (+),score=11.07 GFKZ01005472.1:1171-1479(+)